MNPFKVLVLAALALTAVASAQDATAAPTATSDNATATATTPEPTTKEITVTKDELDAMIAEIKALAKNDTDIAAIFDQLDLDSLADLTPEQARQALNDKVFNATAPPSSANATTAPPSTDAVATQSPSVPSPTGAAGSLVTASVTALAAGIVVAVAVV